MYAVDRSFSTRDVQIAIETVRVARKRKYKLMKRRKRKVLLTPTKNHPSHPLERTIYREKRRKCCKRAHAFARIIKEYDGGDFSLRRREKEIDRP